MMLQVEYLAINMDQVTTISLQDNATVLIYFAGRIGESDEPDLTLRGNQAALFRDWWEHKADVYVAEG